MRKIVEFPRRGTVSADRVDPFGTSWAERIMRRLAGVSVAAVVLSVLFLPLLLDAARQGEDPGNLHWQLLVVIYAIGVPSSLLAGAWLGPSTSSHRQAIGQHARLGGVVGFAVAIVLAVQDEPVGYEIGLWIVASGVFAAFGAGLAAVAAAVALKLHKQAVLPVAVAGVLVIAALSRVADGIH